MTTVTSGRAATLTGALALLGAGCAPLEGRRADTTGQSGGGIGGTGVMAEAAGPGVFGTITALGSIYLNGLHIQTAGRHRAGRSARRRHRAARGRAVGGRGDGRAGDALLARSVVEILPLVGPVEGVDLLQRRITVMGTPVRLEAGTALLDRAGDVALPLAAIVAGRLAGRQRPLARGRRRRLAHRAPAAAGLGKGHRAAPRRRWRGPDRRHGDNRDADRAAPGFAAVTGRLSRRPARRRADRHRRRCAVPGRARPAVVEAFLARNPDDPGYHLSGFGIPMDPASTVPATVGQRSIFVGRYDGSFLIERSFALPEDAGARRGFLERIGTARLLQ